LSPHLIRRARDGNAAAVRALVDALRPRITKMAAYYGRQTGEDADDLLQEAWIGLFNALETVDLTIGQPEAFLIQRAKWRMLDAVKRQRRGCSSTDGNVCEAPLSSLEEMLPSTEWEDAESEIVVRSFAETLKPIQSNILLHLLYGLTWRETGTQLGCTSANVAYHVKQIQVSYYRWGDDKCVSRPT
jgi:RNA polymerase sigma factor (sigma-70 family)